MIRFIDLRGQDTGYRFAFWDTITDRFVEVAGDCAWDDVADLREGGRRGDTAFLERLVSLAPAWAHEPAGGDGRGV